MAIDRPNSFHLMLSNDELSLLRLLAEREGLNASDYLRTLLRREAGGASASPLSRARDVLHLLAAAPTPKRASKTSKKSSKGGKRARRAAEPE